MDTLLSVTELSAEEVRAHLDAVLRRVKDGEEITVIVDGRPAVDLTPHYRPVGLEEFLTWPKAGRAMLDDIRELRGDDTTDDFRDPWERWA